MKFKSTYRDGGVLVVTIGSENFVIKAGDNECTAEQWALLEGLHVIQEGLKDGWLKPEGGKAKAKPKRKPRKRAAKKEAEAEADE